MGTCLIIALTKPQFGGNFGKENGDNTVYQCRVSGKDSQKGNMYRHRRKKMFTNLRIRFDKLISFKWRLILIFFFKYYPKIPEEIKSK